MSRLAAVVVAAIIVMAAWYLGRPEPHAAPPPSPSVAGWEDLGECAGTYSFDGKLFLELRSNGQAEISGDGTKAGRWVLRDNLYRITFAEETITYSKIEVDDIVCMLIKGDARSADLHTSWFKRLPAEPVRDEYD